MRDSRRADFTLVELLTVIAVISVLMAILLPSLNHAKERVKAVSCMSNLKQQGVGTMQYVTDNNDWLLVSIDLNSPVDAHYGLWAREIATYVGVSGPMLADGMIWSSSHKLVSGVFRCPAFTDNIIVSCGGTIGSLGSDSLYNAIGYGWNYWMGENAALAGEYSSTGTVNRRRIKSSYVIAPSQKLFIGDTTDWARSGCSYIDLRTLYSPASSSWLGIIPVGNRHSGNVNMLMGDMHVNSFSQQELLYTKLNGSLLGRYVPQP